MIPFNEDFHQIIRDNWGNFPAKVDYLLFLIFTSNENFSDIILKCDNNNTYYIYTIKTLGNHNELSDYNTFPISEDELIPTTIVQSNKKDFLTFSYHTQYFCEKYNFRGQKSFILNRSIIALRFLKTSTSVDFNAFNDQFIHLLGKYQLAWI